MKNLLILIISVFLSIPAFSQEITGDDILDRIDKNISAKNREVESKMIIHGKRGTRTIETKTYSEGENRAFTEFLSPAREKGTKMLKLEDQLWIYSPSTDRTIRISGHLLRQSLMGSDLSYEDMMDDTKLGEQYTAGILDKDSVIDNRQCWMVELIAKEKDAAYFKRLLWVDKQRYVPLREELYAKSGILLKRTELSDVSYIEKRWFPKRILFKDMLKTGEGTEFVVQNIKFNVDIPEYIFSKAVLKK